MNKNKCCFCQKIIESSMVDPSVLRLLTNIDKDKNKQITILLYCHLMCFKHKLAEGIPLPLEYITG